LADHLGAARRARRRVGRWRELVTPTLSREQLAKLRNEIAADLEARARREAEDPFYDPPPLVTKAVRAGPLLIATRQGALVEMPAAADERAISLGDLEFDDLVEGVGYALAGTKHDLRKEFMREIDRLNAEVAELRKKLERRKSRA
jgi:hypothetical protein